MAEKRRSARNKTAKEIAAKVGCSERTVRYWWSMPRAEYEANSITRAAPWEKLGVSRATWYRNGKPMPQKEQIEPIYHLDLDTGKMTRIN